MDLNLQPRSQASVVTGLPFKEGERVASFLVQSEAGEVVRKDVLESEAASLEPGGFVACSWVQVFKPHSKAENADRALKLTADTLFLTLADPSTVRSPETDRLVRFLALMLERKKLLRPRGKTPGGSHELYEHARTKQMVEVPAIDLTPEFFLSVRDQLSILVGEPKAAAPAPSPAPEPAPAEPASVP
jgi:hypothetical protein